ncbi:MAG: hypothetical protein IJM59_01450 [Proteobacteria bacterium]|nr:hypothetical protein [Pseudomonadota bacterium]
MNTKLVAIFCAISVSCFILGCYDTTCENEDCPTKKVITEEDIDTTSDALVGKLYVGDEFAIKAYHQINQTLRLGKKIDLSIYELGVPEITSLLSHNEKYYHLNTSPVMEMEKFIVARGEQYECSWNINSMYEFCHDMNHFESMSGVSRNNLMPDDEYFKIANHWKDNIIRLDMPENYQFYPYKRKFGVNGSASIDKPEEITETIYEIGVSFASTLDGWPVIGPGGKIYVHLSPDGKILATKLYRKSPNKLITKLHASDIKTADEALKELVDNREYDLEDYQITRAEFGYFYWGKNSVQNILSPHYVFFLAPADSRYTTEVVEIVSAVKGKYAKMIQSDYELEVNRKKKQIVHDVSDSKRPETPPL